jgi:glycosyltransferase involved in cell wall biosynthesis
MAALPRVSLCLLTYRRANVLPRTLDSLLAQTHGDFELIINDDCSPDHTERVCREYAARDSRIRYVRNPRNLRYAGNQNAALRRANTDYVGIVHDGDIYHLDMVEKWTAALASQPTAALVFSPAEQLDAQGQVLRAHQPSPYRSLIPGRQMLDDLLTTWHSPIFGIVMVRRAHVFEAGPFDPRLPVLADIDMWMRLLLRHDAAHVPEPLFGISPREADHHNTDTNWRVREEHELIYALNFRRRHAAAPESPEAARQRLAIQTMFWKIRARYLAVCARHGKLDAFARGVRFCIANPSPLALHGEPDAVLSWDGVDAMLKLKP